MANEKINILIEAQNKASAPLKNVRGEIDKVGASAKRTASQAKGVQDGIAGVGRGAGMAGIQVQQFVGQLQGGVNPMIALSQQSADLGFALGVPLAGAIVSIAAVIAGTLIPSLMEADEAFDSFSKRIKSITQDFKVINKETKAELIRKQTEEVEKANKAFKEENARILELEQGLEILKARLEGSSGEQIVLNNEINRFTNNINAAKIKSAELSLELENEARKLGALRSELNAVSNSFTDVSQVVNSTSVVVTRNNTNLEKEAALIRQQIKPAIQVYFDAKARLLLLEKEGLLTTDEIIARQAQLKKAYETSTKEVDKAKESFDIVNLSMLDIKKSGIQAIEDGFVSLIDGTKSVKDAFKDMARSVLASLIRMQIQQSITNPLAQAMGLSVGTRATGGPVSAGKPYIVGERGPELIVPSSSGNVIPNHELGGGSSPVSVTLNISTGVSQTVRAEIANLMPQITEATKGAVLEARQRGGSYSRGLAGI